MQSDRGFGSFTTARQRQNWEYRRRLLLESLEDFADNLRRSGYSELLIAAILRVITAHPDETIHWRRIDDE